MQSNPLLKPLLTRRNALRLTFLLGAVLAAWIVVLWAVEQGRWELIRGARWQVLSWMMVVVWLLPTITLIAAALWTRQQMQRDVYQVLRTTILREQALTLGYALQALWRMRTLLLVSPFLILMASTYPSIFGGEIVPITELLPLTVTWLLAHGAAAFISTWLMVRWGRQSALWIQVAAVSGVALAVLGLLRDQFAFSGNMTYACPIRIDTAPLLWLPLIGLLGVVIIVSMMPVANINARFSHITLLLALTIFIAGTGWLRNWQRHLDRQALIAIEQTNFTPASGASNWDISVDHCGWRGIQCQCGRVQWIDLRERSITGTLPPQIRHLHYVQHLKLRNNDLTGIPPQIGGMRSLQELSAVDNEITGLPRQIGKLHALTELVLHVNQIEALPNSIGRLRSLVLLDVSNNQLSELPPTVGRMQSLQLLNISSNNLSELPPQIADAQSLQTIWMNFNDLSTLPPEIGELARLDDIAVNDNQLTRLPPELGQVETLQTVSASNNQLTSLPAELIALSSLRGVQLYGNAITELPPNACTFEGLNIEEETYAAVCIEEGD